MHCTLPRKQKRSERHRTLRPTGGGLGLVSDSGIFSGIVCYCGILRHNVRYSAYCGIICTISHFPVQFPLAATRSISFRDSTDLISHFPFQCNFQWPRLDSIINLISQSMMTQNQGNLHTFTYISQRNHVKMPEILENRP